LIYLSYEAEASSFSFGENLTTLMSLVWAATVRLELVTFSGFVILCARAWRFAISQIFKF